MKPSGLKHALAEMNEKQLRAIILDFIRFRRENREWLDAKLKGEEGLPETISIYKKKMRAALFSDDGKISLCGAKRAISDFKRICREPEPLLELMVSYVERGIELENTYGDLYEAFYASMEGMFNDVVTILNRNPSLIPQYNPRLAKIVKESTSGWGHKDALKGYYAELAGDE